MVFLIITALVYFAYQTSQPPVNQAVGKTVIFDFDIASPPLVQAQGTPFNQTSNDVSAYFSSIADPAGFTVKSQESTSLKLSQFSGNYLVDINPSRDILDIKLDSPAVAANFTFATVELQSDTIPIPSEILLTVYRDNTLVGSTKAYGSFSSDSYPQGVLVFSPVKPFNWMRISVPSQTGGTTDFLIDNILLTVIG